MDIFILSLLYTSSSLKSQKLNLLKNNWSDIKSTFEYSENKDFIVRVVFETLDNPTNPQIYKSFEIPVAINQFFTTSTGDIIPLLHSIAEVTNTAFNAGDSDGNRLSPEPEKIPVADIPGWLDLAFASSVNSEEIGSAPKPEDGFPQPKQKDAMLKYYNRHNITTPDSIREWQCAALKKVTKNAQIAKVKLDKLPKDFTTAQKAAISASKDKSSLVVIADKKKRENSKIVSTAICLNKKYFSQTNMSLGQRSC